MDHTATTGRWRLRVTGSRARLWDGSRELRIGDPAAIALAYLALAGPTPRSRLAPLLWPDVATARARGNLRQLVHRMQVEADVVAGDPLSLREHVEVVTAASQWTPSGAAEPLVEPLDDLDPDRYGELASWFRAERERRTSAALIAPDQGWRDATAQGDWDAALAHAQRAVAVDPHAEESHRRVIRAHLELGRVRDALMAYQRCRSWLRSDLDREPDAATAALAQRARLRHAASPAAARSLVELAWAEHQRGRSAAAEQAAIMALDTLEGAGDSAGAAEACFVLGSIARRGGDTDTARAWWAQALRSSASPVDGRARLALHLNLAMVEDGLGASRSAQRHYLAALERARELRDQRAEAIALNNLAHLALAAGSVNAASELAAAALALAEASSDQALLAAALEGASRCATAAGDPAGGRGLAARAYLAAGQHGDAAVLIDATVSLCAASAALGDVRAARSYAQHAVDLARRYQDHDALLQAERSLADLGDASVTLEAACFVGKEADDDQSTAMP